MTEQDIRDLVILTTQSWLANNFQKTKVSELSQANSLTGLFVLGFMNSTSVKAPIELLKGNEGKSVELRNNGGEMQWRVQDGEWAVLYAKDELKGEDGKPFEYDDFTPEQLAELSSAIGDGLEFSSNSTHIQYRMKNGNWIDVVSLELIRGPQGKAFKFEDFTQDQLEALKVKGDPGPAIELGKSDTHVIWRVKGTEVWTDLFPFSEIIGEPGKPGKAPILEKGDTHTVENDEEARFEITYISDDEDGRPVYKVDFWLPKGEDGKGTGDMHSDIYDPNRKNADAFDYNNFDNTPTKLSDFENDNNLVDKSYVDNKVKTDVPEDAVFTDTDTTYEELSEYEINAGTQSILRTITGRRVQYMLSKVTEQLDEHNQSKESHLDIRAELEAIRMIALGASSSFVFETKDDMDAWLLITENIEKLRIGSTLFIIAMDVPDYWWDGTTIHKVEAGKVNLEGYLKTDIAKSMFVAKEANKSLVEDTLITILETVDENAQKNSDITKQEIENKLTGKITTHTHDYLPTNSFKGSTFTSNEIPLNNPLGALRVSSSANVATFTLSSTKVVGAWAKILINRASEPTVTGATKILGSDFESSTNMYLYVMYDGVKSEYYFAKIIE